MDIVHVVNQFYFRRMALIVIAAVMLLLAFVGFLLSIFGLEFLVSV
jgi:hypothetical protein